MLWFKKKKNQKNDKQEEEINLMTSISNDTYMMKETQKIKEHYSKPEEYDRKLYDDGNAKRLAKDKAFENNQKVYDAYTGKELSKKQRDAKIKYGSEYAKYSADADHIEPLKHLYNRAKGIQGSFLTNDDIKDVGNRQENIQVISATTNRSKGSDTNEEWLNKTHKLEKADITDQKRIEYGKQLGKETETKNTQLLRKIGTINAAKTSLDTGMSNAVDSAGHAAMMSACFNITSCIKGEKTAQEACKDIGEKTLSAGAKGFTNGAGLSVINQTLVSNNSKFLNALGESNIAGKSMIAINITGKALLKWGNNEITTKECLIEIGEKGCGSAGSYIGGAVGVSVGGTIGATVGGTVGSVIPVVGTAVGSFTGAVLCENVYNAILEEKRREREEQERRIQELIAELRKRDLEKQQCYINNTIATNEATYAISYIIQSGIFQDLVYEWKLMKKEDEERKRVIAECTCLILRIEEYQREMQSFLNTYLPKYKDCFDDAFDLMKGCLYLDDYWYATKYANKITRQFGGTPLFEDLNEFINNPPRGFGSIEL